MSQRIRQIVSLINANTMTNRQMRLLHPFERGLFLCEVAQRNLVTSLSLKHTDEECSQIP